jgi:uncharacterized protein YwgA
MKPKKWEKKTNRQNSKKNVGKSVLISDKMQMSVKWEFHFVKGPISARRHQVTKLYSPLANRATKGRRRCTLRATVEEQ